MFVRIPHSISWTTVFTAHTSLLYTRQINPSLSRSMASDALSKSLPKPVPTLLSAVAEDHQEMYEYYDQYIKANGNPDAQERWARQLTWEVARHAVGEEIVIYPLMEKHLGEEGKKLADQDRADHQQVKLLLSKLEELSPGTAEHLAVIKDVMDHLKPHNDSEERTDLPMLEKAIGAEESEKAAKTFSRTKMFAPTRAHPNAPNKPPFETLAGLLTAPIDKLKDAFAKFPTEEQKKAVQN